MQLPTCHLMRCYGPGTAESFGHTGIPRANPDSDGDRWDPAHLVDGRCRGRPVASPRDGHGSFARRATERLTLAEGLTVRLELASIAATSGLAENGHGDLRMSLKV